MVDVLSTLTSRTCMIGNFSTTVVWRDSMAVTYRLYYC